MLLLEYLNNIYKWRFAFLFFYLIPSALYNTSPGIHSRTAGLWKGATIPLF